VIAVRLDTVSKLWFNRGMTANQNPATLPVSVNDRDWALLECTEVTVSGPSCVTIARVREDGTLTVEATEDGILLVNGQPASVTDPINIGLIALADEFLVGQPVMGATYWHNPAGIPVTE